MTVDKILEDAEFGHLYIKSNARAVRYTFRPAKDGSPQCGVLITAPRPFVVADVQRAVEQMRPRLRQMLQDYLHPTAPAAGNVPNAPHIDWDFRIQTDCLHISFVRGTRAGFSLHHEEARICKDERQNDQILSPAVLQVVCPPDCDFDAPGRQEWLCKVIEEGVRNHAKAQLVPRMLAYAGYYNINLREVKVNNSKSHWGSCGRHGQTVKGQRVVYFNINLSLYTLLLPMPLQRLVLLHELTHTRHMDHSADFHRDLNVWLDGQEPILEKQLKRYHTSLFSFVDNPDKTIK